MTDWTLYFNPGCSKCQGAAKLLREHGVEPRIVEYLKAPPDRATLESLLGKLGLAPRDITRTKEPRFTALGISAGDRDAVLDALVRYPELLERPIIVRGDRAVIGRPPENVLPLLERP